MRLTVVFKKIGEGEVENAKWDFYLFFSPLNFVWFRGGSCADS